MLVISMTYDFLYQPGSGPGRVRSTGLRRLRPASRITHECEHQRWRGRSRSRAQTPPVRHPRSIKRLRSAWLAQPSATSDACLAPRELPADAVQVVKHRCQVYSRFAQLPDS